MITVIGRAVRPTAARSVAWHVILLAPWLTGLGCDRTAGVSPADRAAAEQNNEVVLGSPELFAGIPGEGPLTKRQIQDWLADESNHRPLKWKLPPGLYGDSSAASVPADNPLTRAKIELGRQLFFDYRLSDNDRLSCVDCHHPLRAFSSDLIGHERLREPPAIFNRIFGRQQFWDGRAESLEQQPTFAIQNPDELNSTLEDAVERIAAIDGYRLQFERIFGHVDIEGISQALACFERAVVTGPSAWDYHQMAENLRSRDPQTLKSGEAQVLQMADESLKQRPLTEQAGRGAKLFFSDRLGCSRCHSGANFSDEAFHDVGSATLPAVDRSKLKGPLMRPRREQDAGRMQATGKQADRGAFKTPTLRNISRTPPYLHDGRFLTLEAAVDFFLRGGDGDDSELQPIELSAEERSDLLAFLNSLDSPLPKIELSRLPQ